MNLPLDTPPGIPPEIPVEIPPEIREPEFPGEHAPISDGPRFSTAPSSGRSVMFAASSRASRTAPIAFGPISYPPTFH